LGSLILWMVPADRMAEFHSIGDVNRDGVIDQADIALIQASFGSHAEVGNWNPDADINGDGVVNQTDLSIAQSNFGKTFHSLGDVNGDGVIDQTDLALIQAAFGSHPGSANWNPACDLNGDGKVDIRDVAVCEAHQGWTEENFHAMGDANRDGVIDIKDIALINAAMNSYPASANWNADADINGDGVVDIKDLAICSAHQGLDVFTWMGWPSQALIEWGIVAGVFGGLAAIGGVTYYWLTQPRT
jgi:Ca2+-binding EF-hand superfamily protein